MKHYRYIILAALAFVYLSSSAQLTTGITNQPDTSYTTYSAFIGSKKKYPDIKIVEEFHSASVKENRNIIYCTTGKRELHLDAFFPSHNSKEKRIAIMFIHGGGWRSGNRTQHYPLAQCLADLGYVCFTPEYRLSTESLYPAAVYDLKAALRWIHANAKKYNIDTAKIVVAGFSAGGQLAALLGTTNNNSLFEGSGCNLNCSSNVQALIDMDGILSFTHPESGEGDDSKRTSASTYWFGYSKKENPKLLDEASALNHVDKNTPPVLFINSSVDRMHAGRTDFIKVLDQYNIYSDIKTFADAPHSFPLFDPWFEPTLKYMDEFLKKIFLKNKSK